MRHKHPPFTPAVALVTAYGPEQDISPTFHCLLPLLDVQRADVRAEHVVPEGQAQVGPLVVAHHRTDQPSDLVLLGAGR